VLTLAVLAQWHRFRSERDFWRFAHAHLRSYFPTLRSQSQFNRRVRSLPIGFSSFIMQLRKMGRTLVCLMSLIVLVPL
jgi:hypothetical protein